MLSYSDDLKHLGSEEPHFTGSSVVLGRATAACSYSSHVFTPTVIECGVPQGLAPSSFSFTSPICRCLIEDRGRCPHHQLVHGTLQIRISECIDVVSSWMRSHRLQLNTAKTEVIWLTTGGRRMHQPPQEPFQVGSAIITPVLVVRDLGIYLDADASMRFHVMRTTSACFAVLRQCRSIRRSISRLSSSPWCRVWCYRSWIIAPQY